MASFGRGCLVAMLIAALLNLPAMAAGAKPLGMVVTAENAHLGGANAAIGADVYTGDNLQTEPGGTLRLKVGSTQLYLASASAATLLEEAPKVNIKLVRGTVGFSSAAADQFEVETPIGRVRAADGQRGFGEVTVTGPQTILVAAYHGSLVFEGDGEERTIKEGDAYNITLASDPEPSPQGGGSTYGKKRNYIFTLIIIAGAAVIAAALWHEAVESPSRPPRP